MTTCVIITDSANPEEEPIRIPLSRAKFWKTGKYEDTHYEYALPPEFGAQTNIEVSDHSDDLRPKASIVIPGLPEDPIGRPSRFLGIERTAGQSRSYTHQGGLRHTQVEDLTLAKLEAKYIFDPPNSQGGRNLRREIKIEVTHQGPRQTR